MMQDTLNACPNASHNDWPDAARTVFVLAVCAVAATALAGFAGLVLAESQATAAATHPAAPLTPQAHAATSTTR